MRRRPKQLDEAPLLFKPVSTGSLVLDTGDPDHRGAPLRRPAAESGAPPAQGWVATTESGERRTLEDLDPAANISADVRRTAQALARLLNVRQRSRDRVVVRGSGQLVSVPYRYGSDDIDLDRTLEVLAERPAPHDTDIVIRERMRGRRAVALIVDVSGSMRGEKVRIAAAAVAALARDLVDDDLAIVAFWKHAVVVKPMTQPRSAPRVLDDLLRIPAKGLTNVGFALAVAREELHASRARRRFAILLSDAVHNAGPDPRLQAAHLTRLDVLLETEGEHDADLASDLARLGRGHVHPVRDHRDVAASLNQILAR